MASNTEANTIKKPILEVPKDLKDETSILSSDTNSTTEVNILSL